MNLFINGMNNLGQWLAAHLGPMSLELFVLALVVYAVIRFFRIKSPTLRHLFWALVLLKPVVCLLVVSPFSLFTLLPERPAPVVMHVEPTTMPVLDDVVLEPEIQPLAGLPVATEGVPIAQPHVAQSAWASVDRSGWLAFGWITITAGFLLRLLVGLIYVQGIKRKAIIQNTGALADAVAAGVRFLRLRRGVRVALTDRVQGPVLAGIADPMILFPTVLVAKLTPEQLELLVAHELAHAQRYDNAWLLSQRLAESLLFFHPAIWISGRMMRREAEFACDAAVLVAFGKSTEYADSLTRIAELRIGLGGTLLANTVVAAESNLVARVRSILDGRTGRMTTRLGALSALALTLVGCLGLPAGWREAEPDDGRQTPAMVESVQNGTAYDPANERVLTDDEAAAAYSESGEKLYAVQTNRDGFAIEMYYGAESQRPFTGRSIKKYVNGQVERTCDFEDGLIHGVRREWHPTGAKMSDIHFARGVPHGPAEEWYPDGQPASQRGFWHGWRDGTCVAWYEDGQPKYTAVYKGKLQDQLLKEWQQKKVWDELGTFFLPLGIPEGAFTYWYPNGQKRLEGEISKDHHLLRLTRWTEAGEVRVADAKALDAVKLVAELAADAYSTTGEKLYAVQTNRDGRAVDMYVVADSRQPFTGTSVKKYVNGQIERTCEFKDGLADGVRREWFPTGEKTAVTPFKQGLPHGREKRWYANGQLSFDRGFWHGRRDGALTRWYEDGALSFRAFYRGPEQDRELEEWSDKVVWTEYNWFFSNFGIPEGVFTYWYPNGQKSIEGEISEDRHLLRLSTWTRDGVESVADVAALNAVAPAAGTNAAASGEVGGAYFDFEQQTFGGLRLGEPVEEALSVLRDAGLQASASELPRPGFHDRYDSHYRAGSLSIHTLDGKIANIISAARDLKTDRGLRRGDSMQSLIDRYGKPDYTFNEGLACGYYFGDIIGIFFLSQEQTISRVEVLQRHEEQKNALPDTTDNSSQGIMADLGLEGTAWNCAEALTRYAELAGYRLQIPESGLPDPHTGEPLESKAVARFRGTSAQEIVAWILYVAPLSATLSNDVLSVSVAEDGSHEVPDVLKIWPAVVDLPTVLSDSARAVRVKLKEREVWDTVQMFQFLFHRAGVQSYVIAPDADGSQSTVTVSFDNVPVGDALRLVCDEAGWESQLWGQTVYVRKVKDGSGGVPDVSTTQVESVVQNTNGQNLVKNAGVEDGDDAPADWSQGAVVQGVGFAWDRTLGFNSKASLCLNKTAKSFFPIAQWVQTIDRTGVSPRIEISAQVKAENVSKAILDVLFLDEAGNAISHQWAAFIGGQKAGEPPANHDWEKYSGPVDIPKNTKKIQVGLQIYGPGKIWFDDVTATYVE